MNRYNDSGEMIDVSKINRSVIAQESVIEAINAMIEAENSDIDPLQAFALGLYASQFQMKYMIMQAIANGENVTSYEIELLSVLDATENNAFGEVFSFSEINKWVDNWINKQFPHTMELTK
jgi:predicted transcriptional regulator